MDTATDPVQLIDDVTFGALVYTVKERIAQCRASSSTAHMDQAVLGNDDRPRWLMGWFEPGDANTVEVQLDFSTEGAYAFSVDEIDEVLDRLKAQFPSPTGVIVKLHA